MSDADEIDRIRSAHVVALTLVGAACLFAVPVEREERLDRAIVAVHDLQRVLGEIRAAVDAEGLKGPGRRYDLPPRPTVQWFAALLDGSHRCGADEGARISLCVFSPRIRGDYSRLFGNLDRAVSQGQCTPPANREAPFDTVHPTDEVPDDALHAASQAAFDTFCAALRDHSRAARSRQAVCEKLAREKLLSTKMPSAGCDAKREAERLAKADLERAIAAVTQAQERLLERSRVIQRADVATGVRAIAGKLDADGIERFVSVSFEKLPGSVSLQRKHIEEPLQTIQRSGALLAINDLDLDSAAAAIADRKTEAQLGGELLGIHLLGVDVLRWFAFPLAAVCQYAMALGYRLRHVRGAHWFRGGLGVSVSVGIALAGVAVLSMARHNGRIGDGWVQLGSAGLLVVTGVGVSLLCLCHRELKAREKRERPPEFVD